MQRREEGADVGSYTLMEFHVVTGGQKWQRTVEVLVTKFSSRKEEEKIKALFSFC